MSTMVNVHAPDPVSRIGITTQLGTVTGIEVAAATDEVDVAIVVSDAVDAETIRTIRSLRRCPRTRVVAVVSRPDDAGVVAVVEAGASGLVRRAEADGEALREAVVAAASDGGALPPDLLGRLLRQVALIQRQVLEPRGLALAGLSEREAAVLRLVADGLSTAEIASRLSYSERTIKNAIQDVVSRFQLRNRAHAVAFAVREGFI